MRRLAALMAILLTVSVLPRPAEAASTVVGVLDSESTYVNFAQLGWNANRPVKIQEFLEDEGYDVVELGDADLEDPSALAAIDVLYLPLTRVMSEEGSLAVRDWVEAGGGLIANFISPRMMIGRRPAASGPIQHPRHLADFQQYWTCPSPQYSHGGFEFWAREMNSNAFEYGPLSEAYQQIYLNDPSPDAFSVVNDPDGATHPIVAGVQGELGITSVRFDRPDGAGAEFNRLFAPTHNSNVVSLLEFDIASGTGSYEGVDTGQYDGYTAAQAIEYGAGRIVYFDFDPLTSLPNMNATQAAYVHEGVTQGEIAGSMIRHSIGWVADPGTEVAPIERRARTWGEVDVYNTGIYVRQYLEVTGNVSTSGELALRIYNPAGTLVYEHIRELIGNYPSGPPLMYSQPGYIVAGLETSGTYRVEVSYTYSEPYNSRVHLEAVNVVRNQGINLPTVPEVAGELPARVAGPDRYSTAVEISKAAWSPGVATAYVATASNFPDALAGGAIATDGPILLTSASALPAATAAELRRLDPARIVVLGGLAAVSGDVEARLASYTDGDVIRLAGPDRYSTAAAISEFGFPSGADKVYLATGSNFPDALAAGPLAATEGTPILLTAADAVPSVTLREIRRLDPDEIVVLGGVLVISDGVADVLAGLASVTRVAGSDRNATAAAVARLGPPPPVDVVYIATNANFPDALAGGVLAAVEGGPILLVSATTVPTATARELNRLSPDRIVILGGAGAVSESVRSQLAVYQGG